MIIGRGLLASAFTSYKYNDSVLIFAKGVSNSQEVNSKQFERERVLLKEALANHKNKIFVYFGTCSILDIELCVTPYVRHKLEMEALIKSSGLAYYIFRLPQAVGNTSSPTLINYLATKIKDGESFSIWKGSARDLIDVDDVFRICDYIIENKILISSCVNVATNIKTDILNIVCKIEDVLNLKANYTVIDKGTTYSIDVSSIEQVLKNTGIKFDDKYVDRLLQKYLG